MELHRNNHGEESRKIQQLTSRITELEERLFEAESLIDAIKSGEVDAFAVGTNDTTEVYTLQSGDYAYRVLIEAFEEGALNVLEDGLIVYTNPYFLKLVNLAYDEVVGSRIYDFIHPDSKAEFEAGFAQAFTVNKKLELELLVQDSSITVCLSLTSLQPTLASVGIIITDLTEQKKHETQILNYQKSLEDNILELSKSNHELASFTYVASHDLQEPMRKIQTFAGRLLEKEAGNLTEDGKDKLNRMQTAANRMQNLIVDLLAYSRTKEGLRIFKSIRLETILAEVKEELVDDLQHTNIVLEPEDPDEIKAIPFQLRQLFLNLISNSIKFSRPGVQSVIRIKSQLKRFDHLPDGKPILNGKYHHISFSDNGIGFEPEYNEKIFEIFTRLHGKDKYTGTGIGLAIVKKIVENHFGHITARSEINQGTVFDIYLPAQ